MEYKYVLEARGIKGQNNKIKNSILITLMNKLPSLSIQCSSAHAKIKYGGSYAQGNYVPRFFVNDPASQSAFDLLRTACDQHERVPRWFKITRFTVIEDEVAEAFEIEFNSHLLLMARSDNISPLRNHVYKIVRSHPNSETWHTAYELGSTASLCRSTASHMSILYTDNEGMGTILAH